MQWLQDQVNCAGKNQLRDDWNFLQVFPLFTEIALQAESEVMIQFMEEEYVDSTNSISLIESSRCALSIESFHCFAIALIASCSIRLPKTECSVLLCNTTLITHVEILRKTTFWFCCSLSLQNLCFPTALFCSKLTWIQVLHCYAIIWNRALQRGAQSQQWSDNRSEGDMCDSSRVGLPARDFVHHVLE